MAIETKNLKIGNVVGSVKILEKLEVYIYHNRKEVPIYKCEVLKTKQILNIKENDLLNKDLSTLNEYNPKKINMSDYDNYINTQIGQLLVLGTINIMSINKVVVTMPYGICKCLHCGRENFCMRMSDLRLGRENNLNKSCGCLMKKTQQERGNEILLNKITNNWKYIEEVESDEEHKHLRLIKVECQCCGEIKIIDRNRIGYTICKKRREDQNKFIEENKKKLVYSETPEFVKDNLVGKRYGELEIISFSFYINKGTFSSDRYWLAKCSCNQIVCLKERNFVSGHSRSCGHLQKEATSAQGRYHDKSLIGNVYNYLKVLDVVRDDKTGSSFFKCQCTACGKETYTRAYDVIKGRHKSCGCQNSFGELTIIDFLNRNEIRYESQKKFDDCKYEKQLRFDFYIYNKNDKEKAILVEFQGSQHYKLSRFSEKETDEELKEKLRLNQLRDQIKRDYCDKNNIPLLEIPYWKLNQTEEILYKFLIDNDIISKDQEILFQDKDGTYYYNKKGEKVYRCMAFEDIEMDIPKINPVTFKTTQYNMKNYMDKKVEKSKEKLKGDKNNFKKEDQDGENSKQI